MNKQLIGISIAAFIVAVLFFFGKTTANKSHTAEANNSDTLVKPFSIEAAIAEAKKNLPPSQINYLSAIENSISRGGVANQQILANKNLANFWKDSAKSFEPYIYYISEASKLENSEKSLTFAAQLLLDNLRTEQNEAKINWKSELAIRLFEKAIALNPHSDDLKIGLGSVYIFGKGRFGSADETMKGVQQVLSVVREDSANMKAQLVLGIGGYISRQYDKAIYRLQKVVTAEPDNLEAIAYLADAYAANGNKTEAIRYYEISKRIYNNPHYTKEVNERIKQLQ